MKERKEGRRKKENNAENLGGVILISGNSIF